MTGEVGVEHGSADLSVAGEDLDSFQLVSTHAADYGSLTVERFTVSDARIGKTYFKAFAEFRRDFSDRTTSGQLEPIL